MHSHACSQTPMYSNNYMLLIWVEEGVEIGEVDLPGIYDLVYINFGLN